MPSCILRKSCCRCGWILSDLVALQSFAKQLQKSSLKFIGRVHFSSTLTSLTWILGTDCLGRFLLLFCQEVWEHIKISLWLIGLNLWLKNKFELIVRKYEIVITPIHFIYIFCKNHEYYFNKCLSNNLCFQRFKNVFLPKISNTKFIIIASPVLVKQ